MFRRFRRPLAAAGNPQVVQTMRRVQAFIAEGQPAEAAMLLSQAGQQATASGHPLAAANLHAQAAHLYADAQDEDRALSAARLALDGFLTLHNQARSSQFYKRISAHLEERQMGTAAVTLAKHYERPLAALTSPAPAQAAAAPVRPGRLPAGCPQCNAPLRPDEVEWLDDRTAECPYCGSVLPAQD